MAFKRQRTGQFEPSRRRVLAMLGTVGAGVVTGIGSGLFRSGRAYGAVTRNGIDYAWGRPRPSVIRSSGYTFVCRYLSWDTTGKNLTASEAQALIAAGLDIVCNWEYNTDAALSGFSQGVSDAQEAQRQAVACGMPAGRPVYFSVDFDASPDQQAAINSYFDGVASVIGVSRVGAYAGYYVIQRLFDAGKIRWGWQTVAWSGGNWDVRAQLRQPQVGITVDGVDCDSDTALTTDFGQWPNGNPNPEVGRGHVLSVSGGKLYHQVRNVNGTWTGWQPLNAGGLSGAGAATSVTGTTDSAGDLQVVAVLGGTNYHRIRYTDGTWSGWGNLGPGTQVSASIDRNANVMHLAAVINGTINHRIRWADGTWSGWGSLGAGAGVWISVDQAHNVVQMVGLAVNGDAGHLYHRLRNADGSWTGWGLIDGSGTVTTASATADDNGNLQVLEITDGTINHRIRYADGTWSGWGAIGANATAAAGSVNFTRNDMQAVAVIGGALDHRVRNADGTWTNWGAITPPGGAPTAVAISVV